MANNTHHRGPTGDPVLERARGMDFLRRFINGSSVYQLRAETGFSRWYISKVMKKAAQIMVDQAQETIMGDVFPLVVDVAKAHLKLQLKLMNEGKSYDMAFVDRVLKGMYVFDAPVPKAGTAPLEDGEEVTLATVVQRKLASRPPKTLPQPTEPVIELEQLTNGDNTEADVYQASGTRSLPLHPDEG